MIGGRSLAAIGWFLLVPHHATCATRSDAPRAGAARAAPDERLHVLFLGDRGHHEPAKRADEAYAPLAKLGIDLTYTDDVAALNDATLKWCDAVLIYANQDVITREQLDALLHFVRGGKGLVAVHCASYCFRDQPEYVALVGGQFDHHAVAKFTAKIVAPDHEALLGVSEFETTDETYVHSKLTNDREVLMVRREGDRDEPYTWVRAEGKGRVYYTALGHDHATWGQPAFHEQLAQAIRWAAGQTDFTWTPPQLEYGEAKLPNYTPGAQWGREGEPITKLQKPLSPQDERRMFALPPGFDAQLFASEPEIVKPIAMSFDTRGRLWIAETVDYPNDKREDGKGHDRIDVIEGMDDHGHATKITRFVDGLNIPTSIAWVPGGVIVAQAPDVLFLEDKDGDGVCDGRRVLFTGFGISDTHAGPSNFRIGPDGWIWGTVGYAGFNGDVGGQHHQFMQAVFRFKRDGSKLERMAGTTNNTWGLSFDQDGEIFASTANGDHLVHVAVPAPAIDSVFGLVADGTVHIPEHDRLHALLPLRQVDYFGGFTAAAGCAIYTDDRFPKEYWNRCAFVCEPTGHLVHQCFLEPKGSTFVAHDGWNLLASMDEWTAPIAAEVGPDGDVWVLDWYSPVVQHNPTPRGFTTGKGNAYETPYRDKGHGRIWRIGWRGAEARPALDLTMLSEERRFRLVSNEAHPSLLARILTLETLPLPPAVRESVIETTSPEVNSTESQYASLRRLFCKSPESRDPLHVLDWSKYVLSNWSGSSRTMRDRPFVLAGTIALASCWSDSLPFLVASGADEQQDATSAESAPTLRNASFESHNGISPSDWHSIQYSGRATHEWSDAGHAAPGSMKLSSPTGSDSSVSQSVRVQRGATYRLSGWIKTEDVVPLGGAYGALFNVHELQSPRIRTPAVTGTHDWTRVEVTFDSGEHEQLTINCLLGGWGLARGTAWFDDVELALVRRGSPRLEALAIVAMHAAHAEPAKALELALPMLATAPAESTRAVLDGFAKGWPHGAGAVSVELAPAQLAQLKELPSHLDTDGRAALLAFVERCGRLDLFPEELTRLRGELAARLASHDAALDDRVDAARRLLGLGRGDAQASNPPAAGGSGGADPAVAAAVAELTPLADPGLVRGLLLALGDSARNEAGAQIVERFPQLTPTTQPVAIEVLTRRPAWSLALLRAIGDGRIDKQALPLDALDRLLRDGNAEIATLAKAVAQQSGRAPRPDRQKVLDQFLPVAQQRGDATRGALVFEQNCAKCHTRFGKGGAVGPDLTGIGSRGKADLLLEILDPNRTVEGNWRAWDATLKNGDSICGRLVSESADAVELLDASGARHVLRRADLDSLEASKLSLMPNGFEQLGEDDLRALLEYLVAPAGGNGGGSR